MSDHENELDIPEDQIQQWTQNGQSMDAMCVLIKQDYTDTQRPEPFPVYVKSRAELTQKKVCFGNQKVVAQIDLSKKRPLSDTQVNEVNPLTYSE